MFAMCALIRLPLDHMANMPENVNKENPKYLRIKEQFYL